MLPSEVEDYEQRVAHARDGAGAVAFEMARVDGRRMTAEAVVAYALGTREPAAERTGGHLSDLSR